MPTITKTITKKDLVNYITDALTKKQADTHHALSEEDHSQRVKVTKVLVKEVLETFLEEVVGELALGHRLEFREFGVFEVRQRLARKAQNPRTLEAVDVPAKRVVKFKPGRSMRALVCDNPDPLDPSEVSENLGAERSGDPASKAGGSSGGEAGKSASGPDSKSDSGSGSKSPPTPPKPKNPSSPF